MVDVNRVALDGTNGLPTPPPTDPGLFATFMRDAACTLSSAVGRVDPDQWRMGGAAVGGFVGGVAGAAYEGTKDAAVGGTVGTAIGPEGTLVGIFAGGTTGAYYGAVKGAPVGAAVGYGVGGTAAQVFNSLDDFCKSTQGGGQPPAGPMPPPPPYTTPIPDQSKPEAVGGGFQGTPIPNDLPGLVPPTLPIDTTKVESKSKGDDQKGLPTLKGDGKTHLPFPDHVPDSWTPEDQEQVADDLRTSIGTREREQDRLGEDGAHRAQIERERDLLRQIEKKRGGS
jgi:hypothetical protein